MPVPNFSLGQVFAFNIFMELLLLFLFLVIVLSVCLFRYFRTKRAFEKTEKIYLEKVRVFKQTAYKIPVDLYDCEIKYTTRIERIENTGKYDALDAWVLGIDRSDTREIPQCVVTFQVAIGQNTKTFRVYVDKDELTLRILFSQQKTTYIYVDKMNPERYYFDLEFLED